MSPCPVPRTASRSTRTIQETARRHLAEVGAAALSLRAIARDVGMVSSAVYRYFPSRDELLTALIVEAYDELGDAVEQADAGVRRRADLDGRFLAVATRPRLGARQPARVRAPLRLPRPRLRRPGHDRQLGRPGHLRLLRLPPRRRETAGDGSAPTTGAVAPQERQALGGVRPSPRRRVPDERIVRWLIAWTGVFGHIS